MVAASCLTMALPHLVIGLRQRGAGSMVNLFFALAGFSVAWMAAAELSIMRATTMEESSRAIRLGHVPVVFLVTAIVGFVHLYFGTARLWLGVVAAVLRLLCLIPNFFLQPNLAFSEITGLRQFEFLGEMVSMPMGKPSPWLVLPYLSSLLMLVFVVDASLRLWRKGTLEGRRRAVVVGGGMVFFVIMAQGASVLINAGVINFPFFISIPFMAIVAAMGFELSFDVIRSASLARAVRESEERMGLAAESAGLAMWDWNLADDSIWMTAEGRQLLGFEKDERISFESFAERVHPEDRVLRDLAIRQAVKRGGSYRVEYRLWMADGTLKWLVARGRCALDERGAVTRLLGVSMDVTKQKKAEDAARHQQAELTHLSRVALMGEMAASLAHELNQPLTGIVNNAAAGRRFIANERASFQKMDELFTAVAADGMRAGEIIRGIRSMVRKGEEERLSVSMGQIIHSTIGLAAADVVARHCVLHREVDEVLPTVDADAVQIQQVLLNLIINACEAMQETPLEDRRVVISTHVEKEGLMVRVRDHGPGLPVENPTQIFERFFSTKRDGMGMGLAIARGIVNAHGGELTCFNAPGGGACFQFNLPVSEEVLS